MPDLTRFHAEQKVGGGRFALIRELGRGGMGVVWLAQDTQLNEQVALKFLPPEVAVDPAALNDLRRETVRSHRLTHPNIIRLHDFHQQADGIAFISMEYVDGMTLSGWRLQQPQQVFGWAIGPLGATIVRGLGIRPQRGGDSPGPQAGQRDAGPEGAGEAGGFWDSGGGERFGQPGVGAQPDWGHAALHEPAAVGGETSASGG